MRDDAVLRHALPLARGLGRFLLAVANLLVHTHFTVLAILFLTRVATPPNGLHLRMSPLTACVIADAAKHVNSELIVSSLNKSNGGNKYNIRMTTLYLFVGLNNMRK